MADETLYVSIVTRHDTAANWQAANPVLLKGEKGVETDTNKEKNGDGLTPWNDLEYANITPAELAEIEFGLSETEISNLISNAVSAESEARHEEIVAAISEEASDRQSQADALNQQIISEASALNAQIQSTNAVLSGAHTTALHGAFLTRSLVSGQNVTLVPCDLLDSPYSPNTMPWAAGKTLVFDDNGTEGVIVDCDGVNYTVLTKSISPIGTDEPTLLGNVDTFADLPLTQDECVSVFKRNAFVDDYARVRADETLPGTPTTERYITDIDADGNLAWGNYIVLNTSDYQAQSGAEASGKLLTGGAVAGTFGEAIEPDVFVRKSDVLILNGGNAASWSE